MEQVELWKRDIKLPTAIGITGKRNTGKSYYARWLLYLLTDEIDILYVICPTLKPKELEEITKPEHIIREYKESIIKDIVDGQVALRDSGKEMKQIVILLDDAILEFKKNDETITKLYLKGRHYNITPIIITQKFRLLATGIRDNMDYCFCTRIVNELEKETVYKEYNDGRSKKEFYKTLEDATMNYGVLVIDNTTGDRDIFFKDKAPKKLPDYYVEEEVGINRRHEIRKRRKKLIEDREREEKGP